MTDQKDRQIISALVKYNPTTKKIIDTIDEPKVKIKEAEIDFGETPFQTFKEFEIKDTEVTSTSRIIAQKAIKSPSDGRNTDEVLAETLDIGVKVGIGVFLLTAKSLAGSVAGKFIIWYLLKI